MTPEATSVPADSDIASYLPEADFADAFSVLVPASDKSIERSYEAIATAAPDWFRQLFKLRNRLVRPLGLVAPRSREIDRMTFRDKYAIGDRAGAFLFYGRSDSEIILGGDDRHLDFRLSVHRAKIGDQDRVTVSTLVKTHNLGGKFYLTSIMAFHKIGIMAMLENAARRGQL